MHLILMINIFGGVFSVNYASQMPTLLFASESMEAYFLH